MPPASSQTLTGRDSLALQLLEQVAGARFEIRLASFDLDGNLYDGAAFVEAVKGFLLSTERARLRVLLNQARGAVPNAPRLIELGRRLSSRVEFRELAEQDRAEIGERLIIDAAVVLERRTPEAVQARLMRDDPQQTRQHIERFDALWSRASDAAELRALSL